jgi:hypothetical protein
LTREAITSRDRHAVGAGREGQRHAVLQHRFGQRHDVVDRGREAAVEQRAGAGASISACEARGPGPQATCLAVSSFPGPGRAERTSVRIASTTDLADRHAADQRCAAAGPRVIAACGLASDARGVEQHLSARPRDPDSDVDLHQEAVELRFGQRVGAFLLDRVLRGQHVERLGQIVGSPATVTCRSCIACSSADWVRGEARLISSAISSW